VRFDLSEATRIKGAYREVRSHVRRNDARIGKQVGRKYGTLQRDRGADPSPDEQAVVDRARDRRLGIVIEDLKGIRRLYRKGNGQGRNYRYRLNSWSYRELQRQIEYKARWEGIPVFLRGSQGDVV
jgi:putative transposase